MNTRSVSSFLFVALFALVPGCGGGGGGDGAEPPTAMLVSWGMRDGYITPDDTIHADGFAASPRVGDDAAGVEYRQLFCFVLSDLPDGISIDRAELRVDLVSLRGEPYAKLGDVVVDCVRGTPTITFDGGDVHRNLGPISTRPSGGIKTLDVTDGVRTSYDMSLLECWFRLRFHAPLPVFRDDVTDLAQFEDGERGLGVGEQPELWVWYSR